VNGEGQVGDWLEIKGTTTEQHDQRGLITEVHSEDGVRRLAAIRSALDKS
jgi:hypothetical protein